MAGNKLEWCSEMREIAGKVSDPELLANVVENQTEVAPEEQIDEENSNDHAPDDETVDDNE